MKKLPTDKPTMEEISALVTFERVERGEYEGRLIIRSVRDTVYGDVKGPVHGSVWGHVYGTISGRVWKFVETPKERVARLIREGKSEEAIQVMENEL